MLQKRSLRRYNTEMKQEDNKCPFCAIEVNSWEDMTNVAASKIDCPTCKTLTVSRPLLLEYSTFLWDNPRIATALSHAVCRMNTKQDFPEVTNELVERFIKNPAMPTPPEQADNLLLWMGDTLEGPGRIIILSPRDHRAIAGSPTIDVFMYVLKYLVQEQFLDGVLTEGGAEATISFKGWARYDELRRGRVESRKAFMALPFNNKRMNRVFSCFKAAVYDTGFDLMRLDEKPKAGLIDNRLRVEIRTSRFIIADLTDGNQGAYWEGGFAEGLGKPVIYSCEESVLKRGTHFDARNLHTVSWDINNLDAAANLLKITIRATLPDEAKMTDDD